MVKVTGAFQKSTEIMKTTNQLVKLPQLSATMREMSMEMMKVCSVSIVCCVIRRIDLS
jgi:charged multivesicular body protein 3